MREAVYEETITFRLTRACRDYILQRAKLETTTMTQFLRNLVLAHRREAQQRHVEPTRPSS